MKLTDYLETVINFKDEDSKIDISSILKEKSQKGFQGFGKTWETYLLKYFDLFNGASISDTNTGSVQSAFSDFKTDADLYVSLKWVENKKTFGLNLIDNFTGDTAWLATNTSFMGTKIVGPKDKWIEDNYKKKFKGLKPVDSTFCVMICCYIQKDGKDFLNVRLSETKTGKQIFDFCKERLKNAAGLSKRLNTGTPRIGTELFPMVQEIELELEGESSEISNFKSIIKNELVKKSFKDKKVFQKTLSTVSTKISKM